MKRAPCQQFSMEAGNILFGVVWQPMAQERLHMEREELIPLVSANPGCKCNALCHESESEKSLAFCFTTGPSKAHLKELQKKAAL